MTDDIIRIDADRTDAIVHTLRAYARAGMDPTFAAKLLAAAAELEARAECSDLQRKTA
jgi:hypothetical protein